MKGKLPLAQPRGQLRRHLLELLGLLRLHAAKRSGRVHSRLPRSLLAVLTNPSTANWSWPLVLRARKCACSEQMSQCSQCSQCSQYSRRAERVRARSSSLPGAVPMCSSEGWMPFVTMTLSLSPCALAPLAFRLDTVRRSYLKPSCHFSKGRATLRHLQQLSVAFFPQTPEKSPHTRACCVACSRSHRPRRPRRPSRWKRRCSPRRSRRLSIPDAIVRYSVPAGLTTTE